MATEALDYVRDMVDKETQKERIYGEISQRAEREILTKLGITMRKDSAVQCRYLANESYMKADSREINLLTLKLKYNYREESVDLIRRHVLENKERARKRGGEYRVKATPLEEVIPKEQIPPMSFYYPYQNDMIKHCWDLMEKSDPIEDHLLQDYIAKTTAFTNIRATIAPIPWYDI